MQGKSIPDWTSLARSQGDRQGNPGVHLSTFSLPPPGSSKSIKMKSSVSSHHKRGGDLSMQWLSLEQGHPREEGGRCQIKIQFKRQESSFPVTLHKLGFREATAVIAGCLAQPTCWAKSSTQVSIQMSGLSFFWSPLMMHTAKREPQVQGHEFSLGGCLAVTWVSLLEAPGQLGTSQVVSFCSDYSWHGLYESSLMALKSGKPKGDNDFMTATAYFPTLKIFILTNHCMSPILMSHPV